MKAPANPVRDKNVFPSKFFFSEKTDQNILENEFKNDPHRYFIEVDYTNFSKVYRFKEITELWNYLGDLDLRIKNKKETYKLDEVLDLVLKFNTFIKANKYFESKL